MFNRTRFYYEGEGEGEGDGESGGTTTETPAPTPTPAPPPVMLTQEQVNHLLAEEKRKAQKQTEAHIKRLQELQRTAQLTEEEKEKLAQQIRDLKDEHLTKEELAKKKAKEEKEAERKRQKELEEEAKKWRSKYETETVSRSILDAASPLAYNATQFLDYLGPKARLVDELDENGQSTGRQLVKVRLPGRDKDNNPVILDLTPEEAVKVMKDMSEHGNLFKNASVTGTGANNNASTKRPGAPPLDDPAAWREYRKQVGLARTK